ncbi:hypothetical protein KGF56_003668 [Candida oxycetoniae]|uniref:Uncharacterized protein n=1 Tax=Candida oxycetoniae TaxID=497107 RepID=A0AAI9SV91_9ASCO|nr:uncharacterized protein KGF56_003668 [Candida oxycetoniae]KAI3403511.2 hypothetical protein KGF56_003668 [Candida oxycetoniae]
MKTGLDGIWHDEMLDIEELIKQEPAFKPSRLNSLYSNFSRNKQLNPEGYQANIQAWKSLFIRIITTDAFGEGSVVSVSCQNLKEKLALPIYGVPLNLGGILQTFVDDHFLIPESLFLSAKESYFSTVSGHFGIGKLFSVANWLQWRSLHGFRVTRSDKLVVNERYIYWDEMTKLGNQIETIIEDKIVAKETHFGNLFTSKMLIEALKEEEHHKSISSVDFKLLLTYWSRDLKCCYTKDVNGITYVKWSTESDISDQDMSIINVKSTLINLEHKVGELEKRVKKIDYKTVLSQPKELRQSKLKQLMLSKNQLVKMLNNLNSQTMELSTILQKLDEARFNIDYVSTLKESMATLSKLNAKINVKDIDEIRLEVNEEIAKVDDHYNALVAEDKEIEDEIAEEVDKELAQLQKENEEKLNTLDSGKEAALNPDNSGSEELMRKLANLKIDDKKTPPLPSQASKADSKIQQPLTN